MAENNVFSLTTASVKMIFSTYKYYKYDRTDWTFIVSMDGDGKRLVVRTGTHKKSAQKSNSTTHPTLFNNIVIVVCYCMLLHICNISHSCGCVVLRGFIALVMVLLWIHEFI